MATIQDVLDSTIARYQDPSKTLWSDAELLAYANKAVFHISQLLANRGCDFGTESGLVVTISGVREYDLPTNFWSMYDVGVPTKSAVWCNGNYIFPTASVNAVEYYDSSDSIPEKYYITNDKIGFLPTPDDEYSIYFKYHGAVDALVLSPSPSDMPWNGIFNEAISAFVTALANARSEMDVSVLASAYNDLEQNALSLVAWRTPIPARANPRIRIRSRA